MPRSRPHVSNAHKNPRSRQGKRKPPTVRELDELVRQVEDTVKGLNGILDETKQQAIARLTELQGQ